MSNRLGKIQQLLPDNDEGLITEAKMREAFGQTFEEIGERVTRSEVSTMIQSAALGSNNLVLNSDTQVFTANSLLKTYSLVAPLEQGTQYTLTIKGSFTANDKPKPRINGVDIDPQGQGSLENGYYKITFPYNAGFGQSTQLEILRRVTNSTAVGIEWIKLEKGNKATDWTPAIGDLTKEIQRLKLRNLIRSEHPRSNTINNAKITKANIDELNNASIQVKGANWEASTHISFIGDIEDSTISLSFVILGTKGLQFKAEFIYDNNQIAKSSEVITATGEFQTVKIENIFIKGSHLGADIVFRGVGNSTTGALSYRQLTLVFGSTAVDRYIPAPESFLKVDFMTQIPYVGDYKNQYPKILVASLNGEIGWITTKDLK